MGTMSRCGSLKIADSGPFLCRSEPLPEVPEQPVRLSGHQRTVSQPFVWRLPVPVQRRVLQTAMRPK